MRLLIFRSLSVRAQSRLVRIFLRSAEALFCRAQLRGDGRELLLRLTALQLLQRNRSFGCGNGFFCHCLRNLLARRPLVACSPKTRLFQLEPFISDSSTFFLTHEPLLSVMLASNTPARHILTLRILPPAASDSAEGKITKNPLSGFIYHQPHSPCTGGCQLSSAFLQTDGRSKAPCLPSQILPTAPAAAAPAGQPPHAIWPPGSPGSGSAPSLTQRAAAADPAAACPLGLASCRPFLSGSPLCRELDARSRALTARERSRG